MAIDPARDQRDRSDTDTHTGTSDDETSTTVVWVRRIARVGWLSKGFVFVLIGVLAVQLGLTDFEAGNSGSDESADQQGALAVLAEQPFGAALLTVLGLGLVLFMAWNIAQAVIPDSTDTDLLGIVQRIGWFGLGLFYGFLAFLAFRIAWTDADGDGGGGDGGGGGDDTEPSELTARLFEFPGGRLAAGLIAIGILVVAGYHLYKGVTYQFVDDLDTDDLDEQHEQWLGWFGVVGFVARSFVLAATAWFLFQAALQYDADEAKGLDGALREVVTTAYGPYVLIAVGAGLVVAGLYDMVTFRRQRLT